MAVFVCLVSQNASATFVNYNKYFKILKLKTLTLAAPAADFGILLATIFFNTKVGIRNSVAATANILILLATIVSLISK